MPKKKASKKPARRSVARTSSRKTHPLFMEIPQLNALVIVLYILLGILFLAIYLTRWA